MPTPALVPRPDALEVRDGTFRLGPATVVRAEAAVAAEAELLAAALRPATGLPLPVHRDTGADTGTAGTASHTDTIALALDPALPTEGYRLDVTDRGALLTGGGLAGVFYAAQALRQLLPPGIFRAAPVAGTVWEIPAITVTDTPRFGWRGVLIDVARHFLPKRELLRLIDLAALHRLNVLHLHLTDDQGWRMEIRRYPRLTEVGAWRRESQVGAGDGRPGDGRPHGGFYTQDDLREIVAYAAARHLTVVPEIDMPGHVQAALAAYPELAVGGRRPQVGTRWGVIEDVANIEDATIAFFCHILDEVADVFDSEVIHVGGDECPTTQWAADPRTAELMAERGIADVAVVQPYFLARIGAHLAALGRRMAGWDEILAGPVPAGTVVSSWRGMVGAVAAARRGHDVVSCPTDPVYLDFRASEGPDEPIPVAIPITLERAYGFEPVPPQLSADEARHIVGGQANIWTEHMDSPRTVDFFAFPRLAAVAEALWSSERSYDDFRRRLPAHLARLDALGVEYRRESGPLPWQMRPGIPGRPTSLAEWEAFIAQITADIACPVPGGS